MSQTQKQITTSANPAIDTPIFNAPVSRIRESTGITLSQYERLQAGMSYEEAVRILGKPGVEISRGDIAGYTTVMYKWDGESLGANMNAMFQNNRMITKAQFGLR
jgi:hypothetical protein